MNVLFLLKQMRGGHEPPVVEALVAHVAQKAPPVRDETTDGNAHVVVHLEDLALVR